MSEKKSIPLAAIWSQVTNLLEDGYSLIPVRDKPENNRPAKSPYPYWKKYQERIVTPAELWEQMEKFNTSAVAVICGKISGNLEVIDIDVKWKPGIDSKIFSDIRQLYPNLWDRLRLHKSPSGGFHLLYKIIDQPPPGNQKISSREATGQDNVKSKSVTFVETRGEGGIILIPPSLGYSIFKAEPIPLVTWEERCSLINLCAAYNEIIKIEKSPRGNKFENDYYDENPFEHFNKSTAGSEVLLELGWKRNGESNTFAWFTKPGSTSKERHASFIKSKGVFFFWTTNTEFESQKCYTPCAVLSLGKFGNDYKKTYKELVANGFGKIKEYKEKQIVKRAKELPPNISVEAKQEHEAIIRERSELHPYGVFWQISTEGDRIAIDREGVYSVSNSLGFRLYRGAIYRLIGSFLYKVEERTYQDILKAYIREKDLDLRLNILNAWEHFLQVAGKFTLTRLPLLDESTVVNDTPNCSYKFFADFYIKITAEKVEKISYENLHGYVLADKLLTRNYSVGDKGDYIDFLNKAVDFESMREHIMKVIGFLAHEYKDESTAYIIVMTEQCPDPKQGGGSGKNLFVNLFKSITTVTSRPGEQIRYDEKFFNSWNGERLFLISDVPKDFKFLFLKDITSSSAILKKLFKDEMEISADNLPKIIVNTNYSYEISDGGLRRRIIPLEFTDFFTKNNGVKLFYNKMFPSQWTDEDWAGYNYVMIKSIQIWLQAGLMIKAPELTKGGWKKQFEQVFGIYTAEFIYDNFQDWLDKEFVPTAEFKRIVQEYFDERGIQKMFMPSLHKINNAINDYCLHNGYIVINDIQKKVNGINCKGRIIQSKNDVPF